MLENCMIMLVLLTVMSMVVVPAVIAAHFLSMGANIWKVIGKMLKDRDLE